MVLAIILVLLPLLILIISFTKVYIQIDFVYKTGESELSINVRFWKFIRIRKEIPIEIDAEHLRLITEEKTNLNKKKVKETEKDYKPADFMERIKKFQRMLEQIYHANLVIKKFLSKIRVKSFKWHTKIGVKDASITCVLAGVLWSIKGSAVGIIAHWMKLMDQPDIQIQPEFQKEVLQTDIHCMISFRMGQAMYAMIQLVRRFQGKPKIKSQAG